MKSYPEVQEIIARALCTGDPDKSILFEPQSSWPRWMDHKNEAAKVISALIDSGLILFHPISWQTNES